MIHRSARAAIKLLLAALLPATAQTAWAWQGQGTQESPYEISSTSDLKQLAHRVNSGTVEAASGYEGKYFVLTKDLNYTHKADGEEGADTENNYTAIGYAGGVAHPFRGHFDGQGHTVSGIRIYKIDDIYQGLFGCTYGGEVKNVTLADARITGNNSTGGIVGHNHYGTITNCHVLSDVTIGAEKGSASYHGAIVGWNEGGTVRGCTSAASITTTASRCQVFGGVVGRNIGTVRDCLYFGNTVEGNYAIGAIVGFNTATVQNCYFTSTTITGKDENGGTIANAYCAVGYNDGGGTVAATVGLARTVAAGTGVTIDAIALTGSAAHYDDYHDIITAYSGGGIEYAGNRYYGNGCTVSLTLSNAGEAPAGYMFAGAYTASAGTLSSNATDGYTLAMPDADVTISADIAPDPEHFSVSGDEYTIKTPAGWGVFCDAMEDNDNYHRFSGKTVKLADDITVSRMAGGTYHDFLGTFDGQGHMLTFNYGEADKYSTESYIAPFRNVESGCIIENLHVSGDIYTSGQFAAGIVCSQYGTVTIRNCRSSINIHSNHGGDGTHGGLVANNNNGAHLTIEGCLFDGKLLTTGATATTHCGGFVGWKASDVTITNSLYAPAALADGETEVQAGDSNPSATFARNGATITNSYYTRTLGTAQGKQAHSITAGENVTIEAISGTATEYTVSGITAYKDGETQLPALKYGDALYAGSEETVSLTLNNTAAAPLGYHYTYAASNGTLSGGAGNSYTLTMPAEDVTITTALRSTGSAVSIAYVDEDGQTQHINAIALDGTESVDAYGSVKLAAGAYYVGTDINYTNYIRFTNDHGTILILGDGATMSVGSSTARINNNGIYSTNNLTIYGQSLGTGSLSVYISINGGTGIGAYELLTINGGRITADSDGDVATALYGSGSGSGSVTINGGNITATASSGTGIGSAGGVTITGGNISANGGEYGISAGGVTITGGNVSANGGTYGIYANNLNLGWANASDHIYAKSYDIGTSIITINGGQRLTDADGNHYESNVLAGDINGKHLYPYIATLNLAANKAPDQNYWTTFYCGHTDYEIDTDENACAYTATYADGKLTLHRLGKAVPKATAVIIVADVNNPAVGLTAVTTADQQARAAFLDALAAAEAADALATNDLRGVDTDTPVADIISDLGNGTLYVLGQTIVEGEKHFGFHHYTATEMPARKAFVLVPAAPGSNARALTMVFDDATGVKGVNEVSEVSEVNDDSWYTINGVKLNGKPSKSGLYINNGRKVVIK